MNAEFGPEMDGAREAARRRVGCAPIAGSRGWLVTAALLGTRRAADHPRSTTFHRDHAACRVVPAISATRAHDPASAIPRADLPRA